MAWKTIGKISKFHTLTTKLNTDFNINLLSESNFIEGKIKIEVFPKDIYPKQHDVFSFNFTLSGTHPTYKITDSTSSLNDTSEVFVLITEVL